MPQQTPADDPMTGFGPNEWLVQELQEAYRKDPSSVAPEWRDFFSDGPGAADADGDEPGTDAEAAQPEGSQGDGPAEGTASQGPAGRAASANGAGPRPSGVPDPGSTDGRTSDGRATAPAARQDSAPPAEKPAEKPAVDKAGQKPVEKREKAAVTPTPPARTPAPAETTAVRLRGPAARVVANMETSLGVPTATSVRAVPAKLLIDNRIVLNNHLKRARGGKVSFTHLIGFALVETLREMPEMNWAYTEVDGKPGVQQNAAVNVGIAIDMAKPDGTRQLLVPSIKNSQGKNFSEFWAAYEDVVRRARSGSLTVEDFAGTTVSLTNPGTIGTVHSVPRLMQGQGAIIGVGALEYPAEYAGASEDTLARLAISKTITLTSTYDHRIIQGAQSGDFLRVMHHKLLGRGRVLRPRLRQPAGALRADPVGP